MQIIVFINLRITENCTFLVIYYRASASYAVKVVTAFPKISHINFFPDNILPPRTNVKVLIGRRACVFANMTRIISQKKKICICSLISQKPTNLYFGLTFTPSDMGGDISFSNLLCSVARENSSFPPVRLIFI